MAASSGASERSSLAPRVVPGIVRPGVSYWIGAGGGMVALTVVTVLLWAIPAATMNASTAASTRHAVEIARGVFTAVCLLAWFAHFGEAAYAHHLAKERGRSASLARQWCTQTLLLGYFSLYHLRRQVQAEDADREATSGAASTAV